MKWKARRLGEVAELSLGKMLDERKNRGDLLPYLANVNVRWGRFDLQDLRRMRFQEGELERFGLRSGDIVMCEGGEPGRCAIWNEPVPGMMIQKALHRIRAHACVDNRFLYYAFLHKGRCSGFSSLFTGATIKHLTRQNLANLEIALPPLAIQERIANSLATYDSLISNNHRRMELLEASARRLYEEWFVRLRFPGHQHTRLIDGLPEGWTVRTLGEVAAKIGSGATPRGGESSYLSEGVALFRSQNVYDDGFHDEGLAFLSEQQACALDYVTVQSRDLLLNITGASVARCCMAPERHLPARVNQHVMIIRTDPGKADPFFVHNAVNSDACKRLLLSYAQKGSTREALTKEMISRFGIRMPTEEIMRQYGETVAPLYQQRELLAAQISKLQRARDLLLPRLMSGEIEV